MHVDCVNLDFSQNTLVYKYDLTLHLSLGFLSSILRLFLR